jgi:hypothetical protein
MGGSRFAFDPALAAALRPSAEGFDVHPQQSRCVKDGAPLRHAAAPAGGLKYDLMGLHCLYS